MTSHDVVARVRRIMKRDTGSKKVGHAGTLDPLATGVLILCLGQSTRLSEYVMHTTKQYQAQVQFGLVTNTYDAEGEIIRQQDASHLTQESIENHLQQFIGEIDQLPPMYSAVKQGGRKLYDLARSGQTVERQPRRVVISDIQVVKWAAPTITLDITCGAGTYIRSLAYDLGEVVGTGAYLSSLVRTRSGAFSIENSVALDELVQSENWHKQVIPPGQGLDGWDAVTLTTDQQADIMQGRWIELEKKYGSDEILAYTSDAHLLAILQKREKFWKPHKVFLPEH